MPLTISKISAEQTYELRHKVLWPDKPRGHCVLEGDETALHFGGSIDGDLISVVSVFPDGHNQMRLRKFAILRKYQGQGVGTAHIKHAIEYLMDMQIDTLWCDARTKAIPFYVKQGFVKEGELFLRSGVSYIRMVRALRSGQKI